MLPFGVYDEDDVMNDEFIGQKTIDLKEFERNVKNNTEASMVSKGIFLCHTIWKN